MEVVVGISGASTVAMLLVALFKFGVPSAPSKAIAGIAFLAGQLSAVLVTMASTGLLLDQKVIGTLIITGVLASAAAAGISRTDQSAESKRVEAGAKEPPPVGGEL
jgi:hypothetical protein